jgi:hypothetical protein
MSFGISLAEVCRESEADDAMKGDGEGEGEGECMLPVRDGIRANVCDGLRLVFLGGITFDSIEVENSSKV